MGKVFNVLDCRGGEVVSALHGEYVVVVTLN